MTGTLLRKAIGPSHKSLGRRPRTNGLPNIEG